MAEATLRGDQPHRPPVEVVLHIDAGTLAVGIQYANNPLSPCWNYKGSLIIPPKTSFRISVAWSAAQATTLATVPIRLSLFGILSRRVV